MSDSSADRDPLERLAEEFVDRFRKGERPSVNDYAERHPDLAAEIRDLFPALVEMEQLKPATGELTGASAPVAEPSDPVRVGEFRILRRVGHGGMGVVYEAVQESLGRHVALKLLPAEALVDPRRLERFKREARAAARLHHTNIVPVFGVGEADGRHFYAMQFIAGHPLDAVIEEVKRLKEKSAMLPAAPRAVSEVAAALLTGTFVRAAAQAEPDTPATLTHGSSGVLAPTPAPVSSDSSPALSGSISEGGRHYWDTVARVGAQVADALAYAHGQGILHRDIKPANLLLDLRGTVWVTDFGLAKATDADDLTHAGDVVGTLRYMAPERFDGPGDARADVYALGLTLYELLALKPAFVAENRAKLVQEVTAASPPAPRTFNAQIPRDLETIVLKAIARDPAMRYQSASDLAEDLRRFTEDRPIRARRASSAEQAWRWCRRNKAVASLLAAVFVVFALGAAVASFFAYRADKERAVALFRGEQLDDERRNALAREKDANDERAKAESERTRANDERAKAETERIRANGEATKALAGQEFIRHALYIARINLAGIAIRDRNRERVVSLLRETFPAPGEEDVRGEEWHYLFRQVFRESRVLPMPVAGGVLFTSPTRIVLKTNAESPHLVVLDSESGATISDVEPQGSLALALSESLTKFSFTSDGRRIAFRRGDQQIVCNTETGEETFRTTASSPGALAINAAGDRVAWIATKAELNEKKPAEAGNFAIVVCDTATNHRQTLWAPISRLVAGLNGSLAFAPDGRWLLCTLPNDVLLVDARTGRVTNLSDIPGKGPTPPPGGFSSRPASDRWPHSFSPEGARVAMSFGAGLVRVYDLTGADPTVVATVAGSGRPLLSAKGQTLVVAPPSGTAAGQLFAYDLTNPESKPTTIATGLQGPVAPVQLSRFGRQLLVAQGNPVSGYSVLAVSSPPNLMTPKKDAEPPPIGWPQIVRTVDLIAPVQTVSFRSDELRVFGLRGGEIREWTIERTDLLLKARLDRFSVPGGMGSPGGGRAAPITSPNEKWEASIRREVSSPTFHIDIRDVETDGVRTVYTPALDEAFGILNSARNWSPDSSLFAIAVARKPTERGFFVPVPASIPGVIGGVGVAANLKAIDIVLVIDPVSGRVRREIPSGVGRPTDISFAPDGRTLTVQGSQGFGVYDVEIGREVSVLMANSAVEFQDRIAGVRTVQKKRTIVVLDRTTGRVTAQKDFPRGTPVGFSPSGRWLLVREGESTLVCDTSDPNLPVVRKFDGVRFGTAPQPNPFRGPGGFGETRPRFGNPSAPDSGFLVFGASDRLVGVAHKDSGKVVVSEVVSGRTIATISVAHAQVTAIEFSPDGRRLVTRSVGGSTVEQFWDVGTAQEMFLGGQQGTDWLHDKAVPNELARERLGIRR